MSRSLNQRVTELTLQIRDRVGAMNDRVLRIAYYFKKK